MEMKKSTSIRRLPKTLINVLNVMAMLEFAKVNGGISISAIFVVMIIMVMSATITVASLINITMLK
jgi:hypothetical protein